MGQSILTYPLSNRVDAGIRQQVQYPGLIPEYECREAARWANYNWVQWLELDEGERAYTLAHYRLANAIEANVNDAVSKYQDRLARRRRR